MRKALIILLMATAFAAAAIVLLISGAKCYGHMDIRVYDAVTSAPISDAYIVLPQSDQTYKSDSLGRVHAYGVPLDTEVILSRMVTQPYGNATILAYKEGYIPCCIFYVQLYSDHIRSGPNIYMFAKSNNSELSATTFIESPSEEWVKSLIDKYAPDMP